MCLKTLQIFGLLAVLGWGTAWADDGELVERVAVRNRLFEVAQRWELGLHAGAPLLTFLTDTYNFNLSVAYNPTEWLGIELRGGYALSFNNATAANAAAEFYPRVVERLDELPDTWRMGFNGLLGVRFQPIYGKLSLVADVPVHFQLYLWAGGGLASLGRTSPTLCLAPKTSAGDPAQCVVTDATGTQVRWEHYLSEQRLAPVVSLAVGLRLFIAQHHAVSLEVRSWSYTDSFYVNVLRGEVSPSSPTRGGQLAPNRCFPELGGPKTGDLAEPTACFTTLGQVELGYVVLF
jgi:outer membrane beta-barrel protein